MSRVAGSPPRVWGNREALKQVAGGRFTPTCVGKSPRQPSRDESGSPPRVWGNRRALRHTAALTVHPHVCGKIVRRAGLGFRGSPTLWGNLFCRKVTRSEGQCAHPHVCGEIYIWDSSPSA